MKDFTEFANITAQRHNTKMFETDTDRQSGADMARGLFIGENTQTGKMSMWDNTPNIKLKDCIY